MLNFAVCLFTHASSSSSSISSSAPPALPPSAVLSPPRFASSSDSDAPSLSSKTSFMACIFFDAFLTFFTGTYLLATVGMTGRKSTTDFFTPNTIGLFDVDAPPDPFLAAALPAAANIFIRASSSVTSIGVASAFASRSASAVSLSDFSRSSRSFVLAISSSMASSFFAMNASNGSSSSSVVSPRPPDALRPRRLPGDLTVFDLFAFLPSLSSSSSSSKIGGGFLGARLGDLCRRLFLLERLQRRRRLRLLLL